jgi:hypothetical protein
VKKQRVSSSEILVDSNQSIRRHVPDEWNLQQHYCGKLISQVKETLAGRQMQAQLAVQLRVTNVEKVYSTKLHGQTRP